MLPHRSAVDTEIARCTERQRHAAKPIPFAGAVNATEDHVPLLAARLAVQITVKAELRNGLQAEACCGGAAGRLLVLPDLWSLLDKCSVRVGCMKHI
jgi:hypothetical protein